MFDGRCWEMTLENRSWLGFGIHSLVKISLPWQFCVFCYRCHLELSTKYRCRVLAGGICLRVRDICRQVYVENGVGFIRGVGPRVSFDYERHNHQ